MARTAILAVVVVLAFAQSAQAIDVVSNLNVTAYLGRWYQMYADITATKTFEPNPYCATADYGLRQDGKISVFNAQRVNAPDGEPLNITGYAYAPDPKVPAKLKVHFDVTPVDGPYWVVKIGNRTYANDPVCNPCYSYAIVSDGLKYPSHRQIVHLYVQLSLFVLTRDVELYKAKYDAEVRQWLKDNGFTTPINKPIAIPQPDNCQYAPKPKN